MTASVALLSGGVTVLMGLSYVLLAIGCGIMTAVELAQGRLRRGYVGPTGWIVTAVL
jgi:hypothetical protein